MTKSNTDVSTDLVARLVRLENRVSVVLASFSADLVNLGTHLRANEVGVKNALESAKTAQVVGVQDALTTKFKSLAQEISSLSAALAAQTELSAKNQVALKADLNLGLESIASNISATHAELAAQIQLRQETDATIMGAFAKLERLSEALEAKGVTSEGVTSEKQPITALTAHIQASKEHISQEISDLVSHISQVQGSLDKSLLSAVANIQADQQVAQNAAGQSLRRLEESLGQRIDGLMQANEARSAQIEAQSQATLANNEAFLSDFSAQLLPKLEASEKASTGYVQALEAAIAKLSTDLSAQAAKIEQSIARSEKVLMARLATVEAEKTALTKALAKAEQDGAALSQQLQSTEQRTLSGLLQVQTDSANRTNELQQAAQDIRALIEALDQATKAQMDDMDDQICKALEHKTKALQRLIVDTDSREQLVGVNKQLTEILLNTKYMEAQEQVKEAKLDARLQAQREEIIAAVRVILAETPAKLFNFGSPKAK